MPEDSQVALTLLCEAASERLPELFALEHLQTLEALGARVSLALPRFDEARAEVVRTLNARGIEVVAWLLLSEEEGVYYNTENSHAAAANYEQFIQWTTAARLNWNAVAFDFEPLCGLSRQLSSQRRRLRFARRAVKRVLRSEQFELASSVFRELIRDAHKRSLRVEAYHLPIVADDKLARSDLLHRFAGTPRVEVDAETLMIYTSLEPRMGPALVAEYASQADSVAVGVTGAPMGARRLSWSELSRDLRIASKHCRAISIHSYEGCLNHGMLRPLVDFDWAAVEAANDDEQWQPVVRVMRSSTSVALRGARRLRHATR